MSISDRSITNAEEESDSSESTHSDEELEGSKDSFSEME